MTLVYIKFIFEITHSRETSVRIETHTFVVKRILIMSELNNRDVHVNSRNK